MMALLAERSGNGTYRILSNLPGRRSAGSTSSGLLVAAITTTPLSLTKPSSSVNSWLTSLSLTWLSSADLGCKRLYFVKEYNAWRSLLSPPEHLPQSLLTLTHPFREEV